MATKANKEFNKIAKNTKAGGGSNPPKAIKDYSPPKGSQSKPKN